MRHIVGFDGSEPPAGARHAAELVGRASGWDVITTVIGRSPSGRLDALAER